VAATDKPVTWVVASRCSACFRPKPDHLDDRTRAALFSNCSSPVAESQPPSHRPMWSNTNRWPPGHGSFLSPGSLPGHFFARRHVREKCDGSDCASASGPRADPFSDTSLKSRCHGHTPATRRRIGAALSAAHPLQNEHAKPASTFNVGRRIMAERRRHRRERRQQHRPHARTNANNQIDAQCDEPLRAFVRALAVRLRASCSRRNGRASPPRFIEARQHEGHYLRALLVGQAA
jgi:hypothetical protein